MAQSVCAMICCLLLTMAGQAKVSSANYADWMRDSPYAYNFTVDDMVFPGTHDTGGYSRAAVDFLTPVSSFTREQWWVDFVKSGFKSPPNLPWNAGVNADNLADVIRNFTTTHPGAPVKQQLLDGVRFLDVRVARSDNPNDTNYYLVHEYAVSNLSDLLADVGSFLEEHPGEVVVMLVKPKYNIQSDVALMEYVEKYPTPSGKTLLNLMYTKPSGSDGTFAAVGTIGQMVSSKKTLLPVYEFKRQPATPIQSNFYFWKKSFFEDRFRGFNTPKGKQDFLKGELDRLYQTPKNGKLFQLAYTLTPPDQDAWDESNVSNFVRLVTGKDNLEQLANAMNPTLREYVLNTLPINYQNFINIITFDFYHEHRDSIFQVIQELMKRRHLARIQSRFANWMRDSPYANSTEVYNMVFPGTHDTGGYSHAAVDFLTPVSSFTREKWWVDFVNNGFKSPSNLPWNAGINADNLADVIRNFTTTHPGAPVKQQLLDGVRFLDVRVARSDNPNDMNYYLVHEYAVSNLSNLLADVGSFLEEHPGEVVVMLVKPKYNIQSDVALMEYVEKYPTPSGKTLLNLMYTKPSGSDGTFVDVGTIGQLVSSKKTLLPVYEFKRQPATPIQSNFYFWKKSFFEDRFRGFNTPKGKQDFLKGELDRLYQTPKNGKLFQLAYTLTPPDQDAWDATNATEFVQGVTGKDNLEQLANAMNPTLREYVLNTLPINYQNFINIITFDFYHEHRESIIEVMEEMLKQRSTVTPTSSVTTTSASSSNRFQYPIALLSSMLLGICYSAWHIMF